MLQHKKSVPAARPSDLKLNNRRQILELFKFGRVHSVAGLAREVGVSRQTVMKSIQYFLEKGIIISDGKADSGSMGGKRAELFKLSGDRYLLSLTVFSDVVAITLVNFRCEVVESRKLTGTRDMEADALVEAVSAECERMLAGRGIPMDDVKGMCVTASSIVGADGASRRNPFFPDWGSRLPIEEAFRKRLGGNMQVILENLGKVCGCASLQTVEPVGERLAALLTYRDDISVCLIVGEQIVNGKDDYIDEFGHMIIASEDDEICSCGSRGCLERQVSAARLRRLCAQRADQFPQSPLTALLPDAMTAQDVFQASAAGDPLARSLSEYTAGCFAKAFRNLALIFIPDQVVFQGDYAEADPYFVEALREELRAFRCFNRDGQPRVPFVLSVDSRPLKTLSTVGAYTLLIDRLLLDEAAFV